MIVVNLREILQKMRLRISDVSKATGITRANITNLLSGRTNGITFDTLNKLCKFLSVTPNDILVFYDIDIIGIEFSDLAEFNNKPVVIDTAYVPNASIVGEDIPGATETEMLEKRIHGQVVFEQKSLMPLAFTGRFLWVIDDYNLTIDIAISQKQFNEIPAEVRAVVGNAVYKNLYLLMLQSEPDAYINNVNIVFSDKNNVLGSFFYPIAPPVKG